MLYARPTRCSPNSKRRRKTPKMNTPQHPDQENANIRDIQRGTEDPSDHETNAQTAARYAAISDTPKSDTFEGCTPQEWRDFARTLEGELAIVTAERDKITSLAKWREVDMKRDLADVDKKLDDIYSKATVIQAERDTARAHLRKFGRCKDYCNSHIHRECTCGFDAALEEGK